MLTEYVNMEQMNNTYEYTSVNINESKVLHKTEVTFLVFDGPLFPKSLKIELPHFLSFFWHIRSKHWSIILFTIDHTIGL